MHSENIVVETHGAVRVLRLARPQKKNALTVDMYEALVAAFADVEADDAIRVLRITGAPGVFTAGNDILDFMQRPPTEDSAVARLLFALVVFSKPLVASVEGHAVGFGTTILLHCDFVLAAQGTQFRMPFVNLGLVPEAASSVLLPGIVGLQRASEWLMLGSPFSAEDAHAAGLVNRVVAPAALEEEAEKIAQALAAQPKEALRQTKKLIRAPLREATLAALQREGAIFFERLGSAEAMEAFMAFAARK